MTPAHTPEGEETPWTPHPEQRLFTDEDARFYANSAGKPYQPSNGSEGEYFMARWCNHCARDEAFQANPDEADGCEIAGMTMCLHVDNPSYPKEWRYADDGQPQCTAFKPCSALTAALARAHPPVAASSGEGVSHDR